MTPTENEILDFLLLRRNRTQNSQHFVLGDKNPWGVSCITDCKERLFFFFLVILSLEFQSKVKNSCDWRTFSLCFLILTFLVLVKEDTDQEIRVLNRSFIIYSRVTTQLVLLLILTRNSTYNRSRVHLSLVFLVHPLFFRVKNKLWGQYFMLSSLPRFPCSCLSKVWREQQLYDHS